MAVLQYRGQRNTHCLERPVLPDANSEGFREKLRETEKSATSCVQAMSNFRLLAEPDKLVPIEKRRGSRWLTKYEQAKVLGVRAAQLGKNAPSMIDPQGEHRVLEIARLELMAKVLPLVIQRHLPDGSIEEWPVSELKLARE